MLEAVAISGIANEHAGMGRKPPMTVEENRLRTALAEYVAKRVEDDFDGNQSELARRSSIKQVDISNAINRKEGRNVSLGMLAKIAHGVGPSMPELLADLAHIYATERIESLRRLLAEKPAIAAAPPPTLNGRSSAAQGHHAAHVGSSPPAKAPQTMRPEIADKATRDRRDLPHQKSPKPTQTK